MALKATIYKADLQIADMDRGYYADHALTLARHPSETEERLMVRLFAFCFFAHEQLAFGKGLCVEDEPDLWLRDYGGDIHLWIDVGLPDEKWIKKACNRSEQVVLVIYNGRPAEVWWEQNRDKLCRLANLNVLLLPPDSTQALAALVQRGMRLQCSIQDGQVWLSSETDSAHLQPVYLQRHAHA